MSDILKKKVISVVVNWILWTVSLSALPFIFKVFHNLMSEKGVDSIFLDGDLLLISTVISATSVGVLVGSDTKSSLLKSIAVWAAVMNALLCSWGFAEITSLEIIRSNQVHIIFFGSIIMFIFAVISSSCCVAFAEFEQ